MLTVLGTIAAQGTNATTPLSAFQSHSLGVGFSGSGFLILYFTGVAAILQSLGVINSSTRLAGSSGGAITAAALCSNIPAATDQLAANLNIAEICRHNYNCQGTLDALVRSSFSALLSPKQQTRSTQDDLYSSLTPSCRKNLFVTVTKALPDNVLDPPVLVSNFSARQELVDGVAASSYLPFWSAPSPVTYFDGMTVYDGGFSHPLPCPPGVSYCITVSSNPKKPVAAIDEADNPTTLDLLHAAAGNITDPRLDGYIPLNPEIVPPPEHPDIYPGLSGPLKISVEEWNQYGLQIPDNTTLMYIYNQGRQDAAAWVTKVGLATTKQVGDVLQSTAVDTLPARLRKSSFRPVDRLPVKPTMRDVTAL